MPSLKDGNVYEGKHLDIAYMRRYDEIERAIDRALQYTNFEVYFQPIYGTKERRIVVNNEKFSFKSAINVIKSNDQLLVFMLFAMITINIGLFNLLPIPALDGGHLFFMLIELIIRRPVPQKYVSWIHAAGLVILLGFMAVISFSDIYKWISGIGFY